MLEPGKDYRLTFKLLTQRTSGATTARLVSEANGLWRAFGSQSFEPRDNVADPMPDRLPLSGRGRRGLRLAVGRADYPV